jgi:hypothetical protein
MERNSAARVGALAARLLGAVASVWFLFHASGRGVSAVLLSVMMIWVLAPFAALELGSRISLRSAAFSSTALDRLSLVLTAGSLITYGIDMARPLSARRAFPFVMVPLCSWLLIAATVLINLLPSKRRSRRL